MTSSPSVPHAGRAARRTAVETLAHGITDGTYPIGSSLEPACLARELGLTEATLAEALGILRAKDVIDAAHRVRPSTEWNVLDADVLRWTLTSGPVPSAPPDGHGPFGFFPDLHELRRAVEPSAAALAAQHRSWADLTALDQALTAMAAAEHAPRADPTLAARADIAFHTTLLTASGNRFFAQLPRVLVPALAARGQRIHAGPHHHPLPSHTEVAARVRDMDPDGAYTAMLELLDVPLHDAP
ncbi:FadR/GntR family transcriptional regulator [Streptomyces sp. NPDC050085]|uniref:FadR/GntR family transcriptional regulator n=1 Tax=Streptomyces sp. NPDC050085 TaxID=3365600 RepID=UPI0037A23952